MPGFGLLAILVFATLGGVAELGHAHPTTTQASTTQPTTKQASPTTAPASTESAPSKEEGTALAHQLLDRLAERQKGVQTMRASFVQSVTTPLTRKPIVSKGTLIFRRTPACVQFTISEPRRSVVRFDEKTYQVYRPDKKQAERFLLDDGDLAGVFVHLLAPSTQELEKSFQVTSRRSTNPGDPVTIELDTSVEKIQEYFSKLQLLVDEKSAELRGIHYRNRDGDLVKISLSNVELNAEIAPQSFTSDLPPGTELRVHSVEKD